MSSELEGWINDKNEFVLPFDTMNFPKDTIFLKPISKIKFEKELNKAFHPKLVDNEKVIILDDYILGELGINLPKLDSSLENRIFTSSIYKLTSTFPKEEIYGLTSQIRRCAVSIPSNSN